MYFRRFEFGWWCKKKIERENVNDFLIFRNNCYWVLVDLFYILFYLVKMEKGVDYIFWKY